MKRPDAQAGFSAIEALAALAIVAVALIPLASLQGQIARGYIQQRDIRERASAEANALALLQGVNPMETPGGVRQFGENLTMSWRATPVTPPVRSTRGGQGDGDFNVQLYRVEVEINGPRAASRFSVEQLGWRRLTAPPPRPLTNRE